MTNISRENMKNVFCLFGVIALAMFSSACRPTSVSQGHESVLVQQPWVFGHGGVDSDAVKTGLTWVAWSTSVIEVDMMPQRFDEEFNDIMPKDNNPVDYHAAVRLQITDSVDLVKNFGEDWYKRNIQRAFQNMNRNQVRQYSMPELALQQEVVKHVEAALEKELSAYLKENKIPVRVMDVTLGKISPQKEIIAAYNETGVQQQRAKTEAQRKLAEDARAAAEGSRAIADRAYQDKMGLNADQYIRLQTVKMCAEKQNCQVFLGSAPVPIVTH